MRCVFRQIRAALVVAGIFAVFWGGVGLVGGFLGTLLRDTLTELPHADATPSLAR